MCANTYLFAISEMSLDSVIIENRDGKNLHNLGRSFYPPVGLPLLLNLRGSLAPFVTSLADND